MLKYQHKYIYLQEKTKIDVVEAVELVYIVNVALDVSYSPHFLHQYITQMFQRTRAAGK